MRLKQRRSEGRKQIIIITLKKKRWKLAPLMKNVKKEEETKYDGG